MAELILIENFLKMEIQTQKEYILQLDNTSFNNFIGLVKKKNFKLSMTLSSVRQSNKNMSTNNEQKDNNLHKTKIDIYKILDNPEQPRKRFTEEDIQEKINSIKARGLITPISVLKRNNQYILIAGQMRLEAFKRLNKEEISLNSTSMKYDEIDVFIKENVSYNNDDFAIDALIENINRTDMHVIDTALALKKAFDSQNESLRAFAKILGKSEFYLSSYLTIANKDDEFIEYIKTKDIKNPTIIYTIINLEKSIDEKKILLEKYISGDIKKIDLQNIKKEEKSLNIKKIENKDTTIVEKIFLFKKEFDIKKYKTLNEENKALIDSKLIEIEKLQQEINQKMK